MAFKNFTGEDVSEDIGIVTSGIWQNGDGTINTFFSSSTQYTNTGDYNIDVYRYDPSANASHQFNLELFMVIEKVVVH